MRNAVLALTALFLFACSSDDKVEICNDGVDNDGDALVDCADDACGPGTSCGSGGAVCTAQLTCASVCADDATEVCGDGIDNDCDGNLDCSDADCAAAAGCLTPRELCSATDSAGRRLCLSASRTQLPADGSSAAQVSSTLTTNGAVTAGATCTFTVTGAPGQVDGGDHAEKRTDANGQAAVTYTAGYTVGSSGVMVSCSTTGQASPVTHAMPLSLLGVGSVRVVSADYAVLGARGSGYQEHSVVTFQVLAADGSPMTAGTTVEFTHQRQGESYIGDAGSCVTDPCTTLGLTDAQGVARVVLTSGRKSAVLTVKATVTTGTTSASAVAGGYSVVGAKANGAHLSLDCRPYNVPAFTVHDCLYSRYNGEDSTVDCTVTMADRYGLVLGVPALAAFQSETGNMGPPVFTVPYDITKPASVQPGVGKATGFMSVYGHPLPRDVDPWSDRGEYSLPGWEFGCGAREVNPRDGLVTVIAMVAGEEGFVDTDQNGNYDPGEPFVDIGEPFVDANDDGVWSADEWFEDVNANLVYDGPNGEWDADTHLWTQTRVLYTGHPRLPRSFEPTQYFSRYYDVEYGAPVMPNPTPQATSPFMLVGEMREYGVFFTDDRFNPLSPGTTYEATTTVGNAKVSLLGPNYGIGDAPPDLFRVLYCDEREAPFGNCRYGPADAACVPLDGNGPRACYAVPDVAQCSSGWCTGFPYGNDGRVFIGCDKAGSDVVTVGSALETSKHGMSIGVSCMAPTP